MPTRIRNLSNTEEGSVFKDKYFFQYNHSLDRFVLAPADEVLKESAEDLDIDDPFVSQLEEELNVERINVLELDGGSF